MNDDLTTNASNEAESPAFLVGAVSGSTLPPQYCKDCKNFPCDNYEKHLKCKDCVFIVNQQSNFEPKSV